MRDHFYCSTSQISVLCALMVCLSELVTPNRSRQELGRYSNFSIDWKGVSLASLNIFGRLEQICRSFIIVAGLWLITVPYRARQTNRPDSDKLTWGVSTVFGHLKDDTCLFTFLWRCEQYVGALTTKVLAWNTTKIVASRKAVWECTLSFKTVLYDYRSVCGAVVPARTLYTLG